MEQGEKIRIRKVKRKPRPWTQRAWVRASFVVIVIVAAVVFMTLFFVGKLPVLEALIGSDTETQSSADQNTMPVPSETPLARAAAVPLPSQSENNLAQQNLQVSVFAKSLKIVNEADTPIHVIRLVQNRRYGVAWCDTNAHVNADPSSSSNYSNKVDQVLQIGDVYSSFLYPVCGNAGLVEVFTDQGNATFRLSP